MALVYSGCKTKKLPTAIDLDSSIVSKYWANQMDYNYLEMRGKASIDKDGKSYNVSMHFKLKKDSILWGKFSLFGFEIGRVKITKDSFFLVNSMQSEYMMYDNRYLEQFIGFKADVGHVQSLLLGNAPLDSAAYHLDADKMVLDGSKGIATNILELNHYIELWLLILLHQTHRKRQIFNTIHTNC